MFTRELTDVEHRVTDLFLVLLKEPEVADRDQAARLALGTMARGSVSADFALWLSEGRYTVYHGHILAVALVNEPAVNEPTAGLVNEPEVNEPEVNEPNQSD